MRIKSCLLILFSAICFSCNPNRLYDDLPAETEGYVPVYSNNISAVKQIVSEAPRKTIHGGKIYTVGDLLFQVEQDSGIHIINYADVHNPQKLGFIRSFSCKELSIKNGFIYTNNLSDLVVIDITNPTNIHEVSRVAGVFPDLALQYPPKDVLAYRTYFECADPSKGVVVGWNKQSIKNPKCWR